MLTHWHTKYNDADLRAAALAVTERRVAQHAAACGVQRHTIYYMAKLAQRLGVAAPDYPGIGSWSRGMVLNRQRFNDAARAMDAGVSYRDFAEARGMERTTGLYWYRRVARARGLLTFRPPRAKPRSASTRPAPMEIPGMTSDIPAAAPPAMPTGSQQHRHLRDTGLRIIDDTRELLYPDGRREPAPPGLWRQYHFDYEVAGHELRIVLLRPADGRPPAQPVAAQYKRRQLLGADRLLLKQRARRMFDVKTPAQDAAAILGVTERSIQRWYREFAAVLPL